MKPELIIVAGPTASGKTAAAIELAKKYQTEIISFDSRQFYREMNIGTARPTAEELAAVPHHFIGNVSIHENYNAGKFAAEALVKIEELSHTHSTIILVGGSGLYLEALINGFDELPENTMTCRQELNELYASQGLDALQDLLKEKDPVYYEQVDLNNPQRLIRALEICLATGGSYSSYRKGQKKELPFTYRLRGIELSREELYDRINRRVLQMMEKGLLDEVRALLPYQHLNALQTVGYKELFDYLNGKTDLNTAVMLIQQNTRRYAKRQLTWFRRYEAMEWLPALP